MKKKIWIALLSLCVLLLGGGKGADSAGAGPAPDSNSTIEQKTAVLYTNMTTGSDSPDIRAHQWEYSGELNAKVLADGLSELTGLDFVITVSNVNDGLSIDWAANSTLLANLGAREQKEDFRFSDADSMRWFMMDSLWLTLTKNLKVENIYYTMNGGKDLAFDELYPVQTFPPDLPYMGSAFFFAHADGQGGLMDGRGDLITMSEDDARELVRQTLTKQGKQAPVLVVAGEDIVAGEHALIIKAGENSADSRKFTALYHFAVTDSGAVFYTDTLQGSDWKSTDDRRKTR